MKTQNNLNRLIIRSVGSKAALLRAMSKTTTPIAQKTIYNWCNDTRTIKMDQLINLSKVMNLPICELITSITIKHEGDE